MICMRERKIRGGRIPWKTIKKIKINKRKMRWEKVLRKGVRRMLEMIS